jgi:uncharacterized protein involved in type VI secretion and phage assembly
MAEGLIDTAAQHDRPAERRFYGAALAQVINNIDSTGLGRVQLQLPWMAGYMPWARVAVPMSGRLAGTYFIPQIGDEVVVVFNHGDVREPFVIGSLWNGLDRPPGLLPSDPISKRMIRTLVGHELVFDDLTQSITITSNTRQQVKLDPAGVELSALEGAATVTLSSAGAITIRGAASIELNAPQVTINGTNVSVSAGTSASMSGGQLCSLTGALVTIN